jgi:hypothetical protein
MFDLDCPHCSTRRLLSPGRVRGLVNDAAGIHVTLQCWCGGLSTIRTGRARV